METRGVFVGEQVQNTCAYRNQEPGLRTRHVLKRPAGKRPEELEIVDGKEDRKRQLSRGALYQLSCQMLQCFTVCCAQAEGGKKDSVEKARNNSKTEALFIDCSSWAVES